MGVDYRGTTVLITGASSGLGAEFAAQLADRGANLILVARRRDRLDALADALRTKHRVAITTIAADLAAPDAASALSKRVTKLGLPVHSLVNNAGFGTHNHFADEDPARLHDEVTLNVTALVELTKEFWPTLLAYGNGVLVNVASVAGFQPIPKMAVYGATKAFVLSFTEALWYEAKRSGLRVMALCPGATETEFFEVAGPQARSGQLQEAPAVIRTALRALDRRNPPPSVISGFGNFAATVGERLMPRRALINAVGRLTGRSR